MTEIPSYKIDAAVLAAANARRKNHNLTPVSSISEKDVPLQFLRREIVAALEAAEVAVDDTVEKFCLYFGADIGGQRVRVLEVGTFDSIMPAVEFASRLHSWSKDEIKQEAQLLNLETFRADSPDMVNYDITGASVEVFTGKDGAVASYDLY